jgi:hypothetical protein
MKSGNCHENPVLSTGISRLGNRTRTARVPESGLLHSDRHLVTCNWPPDRSATGQLSAP